MAETIGKTNCMCCGKTFHIAPKAGTERFYDGYAECPFCYYEHVVHVRHGVLVAITHP